MLSQHLHGTSSTFVCDNAFPIIIDTGSMLINLCYPMQSKEIYQVIIELY
jgi:hypothetical protein